MKRFFSFATLWALAQSTRLCAAVNMVDAMYVSNQSDKSITIIDVATTQVLNTIALPDSAQPIRFAWAGTAGMYVAFSNAASMPQTGVYRIDPETFSFSSVTGAFPDPVGLAIDGGTGLFVYNNGTNVVSVVDTTRNEVVGTVSIPIAGVDFGGMAWDGHMFMYVGILDSGGGE